MKASELIEQLNQLISIHGDIEVKAQDPVLYNGEKYIVVFKMLNTVRIKNEHEVISVSYSQIEKYERTNKQ